MLGSFGYRYHADALFLYIGKVKIITSPPGNKKSPDQIGKCRKGALINTIDLRWRWI
jgi:hypothetical protein